jgi:uncharacterized protein
MAGFCRALRHAGLPVTLGEEIDAARAVLALPEAAGEDFRLACRVALLKNPDLALVFEAVFASYWSRDPAIQAVLEDELNRPRPGMTQTPLDAELVEGGGELEETKLGSSDVSRAIRVVLYSADAPSRPRALHGIDRPKLQEMERRARHLRRRIATLPGRRYRRSPRGEVDFRQAARRSLRFAGEWVDLPLRDRTVRRTRLLVVWDVSGSMEEHHEEHFGLVYALQRVNRNARIFAFGTRLHEVTPHLRAQPYPGALARMESLFTSWGGGTRIGESLAALNDATGSWVDRHTVVLILSDGWDVGNLGLLRREMARLARRARFIVWLSPNASQPDFRPEVAGMQTVLPFVDLLLSTEVLSSPKAFRRELGPSLSPLP